MIVSGKETASAAPKGRQIQEAQVIGGLSAREGDVVFARARGLTVKQIAGELGLAEGTVRVLLFRALRTLAPRPRSRVNEIGRQRAQIRVNDPL